MRGTADSQIGWPGPQLSRQGRATQGRYYVPTGFDQRVTVNVSPARTRHGIHHTGMEEKPRGDFTPRFGEQPLGHERHVLVTRGARDREATRKSTAVGRDLVPQVL